MPRLYILKILPVHSPLAIREATDFRIRARVKSAWCCSYVTQATSVMWYLVLTDCNPDASNMANFCFSQPKRLSCSYSLICALSPVVLSLLVLRTAHWHIYNTARRGIPLNLLHWKSSLFPQVHSTWGNRKRSQRLLCIRSNSMVVVFFLSIKATKSGNRDSGSATCQAQQKQESQTPNSFSKKKHQLVTEKHS